MLPNPSILHCEEGGREGRGREGGKGEGERGGSGEEVSSHDFTFFNLSALPATLESFVYLLRNTSTSMKDNKYIPSQVPALLPPPN